jgi:hypothetical protein
VVWEEVMNKPETCTECSDTGKYKVYNAYEPSFEKEVVCEYCQPKSEDAKGLELN